jgi:hypothetical protein
MQRDPLLSGHEIPVFVFGLLAGVVATLAVLWILLQFGVVDELPMSAVVLLPGLVVGTVVGIVLVALSRAG